MPGEPWWPPEVTVCKRTGRHWCFGFDVGPLCFGMALGYGPEPHRDFRVALYFARWNVLLTQNGYTAHGGE